LFIFVIENFSPDISRNIGKRALEEILKTRVEIILLNREQRIRYSSDIKLNDASDIPHAILALKVINMWCPPLNTNRADDADWITMNTCISAKIRVISIRFLTYSSVQIATNSSKIYPVLYP